MTSNAPYDARGSNYTATRRADPHIVSRIAALLLVTQGAEFVEIGCGTGNYTRALALHGGTWCGVDPSKVMLDQAAALSPAIAWRLASADSLPFPDKRFTGAVCVNAIHHFADLTRAFREVRRVLRSGRLVVFSALADQMKDYWLCHYFPTMMRRSIELTPGRSVLRGAMVDAGFSEPTFERFEVTRGTEDLFLYSGKDRPELYFREAVRANITSFARWCEPAELRRGLAELEADLRSGAFDRIRRDVVSSAGDYAFISADALW